MSSWLKTATGAIVAVSTLLGGWALAQTPSQATSPAAITSKTDALTYWTSGVKKSSIREPGAVFGLSALYPNLTASYLAYPYVGTLGKRCLVLVGYDTDYFELPFKQIPEVEVAVFRRYGYTQERGKLFFDVGTPSEVKRSMSKQKARCS